MTACSALGMEGRITLTKFQPVCCVPMARSLT
jgi:hypothetical protein